MAKGIARRVLEGGNSINLYVRTPEKAQALVSELEGNVKEGAKLEIRDAGEALEGEIVIPALPYKEIPSFIEHYNEQLIDKIYVDITNPVDFKTFELIPPVTSSGAEEIAKLLPEETKIVKAFNTTFAGTLMKGEVDGKPLDIFIAGDDQEAKDRVKQLVEEGGMRGLDAGPLKHARILESMQLIHMTLQKALESHMTTTIKILP